MVADWEAGQIRVEVNNIAASANGYEVFLFEIVPDVVKSSPGLAPERERLPG